MAYESFGEASRSAVREAARRTGLKLEGLELLRLGERAVYRLDGGHVVARVGRPRDAGTMARREVEVARWLTAEGLPVVRPLAGEQPLIAHGLFVSLWENVEGDWTRPAALARALRELHGLKPPAALDLPDFDPLRQISEGIEAAKGLSAAERGVLRAEVERVSAALPQVDLRMPRSVIHGDANIGNILLRPDGVAVLFDLGGACWGPPEWDLVTTAVYRDLGWHTDDEYAEFCEVYGFDVSEIAGFPVLKSLQELRMTTWLAQKDGESPAITEEIRQRVADLQNPDAPRNWHPY
ncbi:phosphotransferase enzyme family protein [Actinocorallia aurea]